MRRTVPARRGRVRPAEPASTSNPGATRSERSGPLALGTRSGTLTHATGQRAVAPCDEGSWVVLAGATLVVAGVFLQAFSIAAYARGAGDAAKDMRGSVGSVIWLLAIVVFLAAPGAWWKAWGSVGLALALPVVGTVQLALIGDTDSGGGWINGLHGLGALVVMVLAAIVAHHALRALGLRGSPAAT